MFENKKFEGVNYSRFIASWVKAGGYKKYGFDRDIFMEWLKSIKFYDIQPDENGVVHWTEENMEKAEIHYMDDDTAYEIYDLATCGKCELESNVYKWLSENSKRIDDELNEIYHEEKKKTGKKDKKKQALPRYIRKFFKS